MMDCGTIRQLLHDYIDGELSQDEVETVEEHLATCASCREYHVELLAMKEALCSLPRLDPPAELHSKIMNAISAGAFTPQEKKAHVGEKSGANLLNRLFSRHISISVLSSLARRLAYAAAAALLLVTFSSLGTLAILRRWPALLRSSAAVEVEGGTTASALIGQMETGQSGSSDVNNEQKVKSAAQLQMSPSAVSIANDQSLPSNSRPTGSPSSGESYAQAQAPASTNQKMARSAHLAIEVSRGNVERTSQAAIQAIEKLQGYVESSQSSAQEEGIISNVSISCKVPSDQLDQAVDDISHLGKVIRLNTSEKNVTAEYADLDARLRVKQTEESWLLTILDEAKSVGELLQVEGELSRVRADIESLQGQKQHYDNLTTMSSLDLTITEEGTLGSASLLWLSRVWTTFLSAWGSFFLCVVGKSPFIAVILAVLVVGYKYFKRRSAENWK